MARGNVSTVTRKGQVTIPIEIRRRLGVSEGDQVRFTESTDGRIELTVSPRPVRAEPFELESLVVSPTARSLLALAHLRPSARPATIEEMKEAAALGWTERWRWFVAENEPVDDR